MLVLGLCRRLARPSFAGWMLWLAAGLAVTSAGCRRQGGESGVPQSVAGSGGGFVDTTREAGIDFQMSFLPNEQGQTFKINLYDHGCGVAVGDYDGDGDDDLYFLNQLGANGLYRNRGDATFENVTEEVGVGLADRISVGATFADYDNDGDQDLFVTSTCGGNVLFRNEGQGRLVEATSAAGLQHVGHSQTPTFFDYDNDGWLDLYLVQTSEWTKGELDGEAGYYPGKGDLGNFVHVLASPVEYNILYHNNRDGTFTDVTASSGLKGRGWAGDAAVFDYDQDGWLDVLVTSMFGRAQLYRNQQDGSFVDVTLKTLGKTPFGGIGAKVFDSNNDGLLDIYVVDMHSDMWMGVDFQHRSEAKAKRFETRSFDRFFGPIYYESAQARQEEQRVQDLLGYDRDEVLFGNAFYQNLGKGEFREVTAERNLETFWPWGIAAGDFDNDGATDLFLASGMGYPFYYWPNALLMNNRQGAFIDRAVEFGVEPPRAGPFLEQTIDGQRCPRSSRCTATADFDGDGRLEIVVNNFNHEPYFFHNGFPQQNYVAFRLTGTQSNRDAIGAVVKLHLANSILVRQVDAASGYLSQSSKDLHFGLGYSTSIDQVEIKWPSGRTQVLDEIELNRRHEIREPGD